MSEGQSQRSVASSAQHRQEAEDAAAEERERATVKTAATTARAVRAVMVKLAAPRAEVEAAATVDAAHVASAELEADATLFLSTTTETAPLRAGACAAAVPPTTTAAQTGVNAPAAESMEIAAFTGGTSLPPRIGVMVTMGFRPLPGDVGHDGRWPTLTKTNHIEELYHQSGIPG
jgi:hypothetical protein